MSRPWVHPLLSAPPHAVQMPRYGLPSLQIMPGTLEPQLPRVSIEQPGVPSSKEPGWGQSYGVAQYPALEGDEITVTELRDLEPAIYTISLDRKALAQNLLVGHNSEVFCRVIAGVGGQSDSVDVDWNASTSFSIVASRIRILAVGERLNGDFPYTINAAQQLQLSCAIGRRPRPGALPPTRSIRFVRDAAGWTASRGFNGAPPQVNGRFNIPDFALRVFVGARDSRFDPGSSVAFGARGPNVNTEYTQQRVLSDFLGAPPMDLAGQSRVGGWTQTAYPYAELQTRYQLVFQLGL